MNLNTQFQDLTSRNQTLSPLLPSSNEKSESRILEEQHLKNQNRRIATIQANNSSSSSNSTPATPVLAASNQAKSRANVPVKTLKSEQHYSSSFYAHPNIGCSLTTLVKISALIITGFAGAVAANGYCALLHLNNELIKTNYDLNQQYNNIVQTHNNLNRNHNELIQINNYLNQQYNNTVKTINDLNQKHKELIKINNYLNQQYNNTVKTNNDLNQKHNELIITKDNLNQQYIELKDKYVTLKEQINTVLFTWRDKYTSKRNECAAMQKKYASMQKEYNDLKELPGINHYNNLYHLLLGYKNSHHMSMTFDHEETSQIPNTNSSKIPNVEFSQIKTWIVPDSWSSYQAPVENLTTIVNPSRKITIVTAYDEGIARYANLVIPNQKYFAKKHNYQHIEYFGKLAENQGANRALYWSKIVAINDVLKKTEVGHWIAWIDASVLFTNTTKNFDQIIEKYHSDKDVILTNDPQLPINNAVFLVRNTPWTKNWINKVWERNDLAKGGEGNCWSGDQPFCHYEQQAMTELFEKDKTVQKHTVIIPNKVMNSFYRYSHIDLKMFQDYDSDQDDSQWTPGDFVCKVTGMSLDLRNAIISYVSSYCIDQTCIKLKKFRRNFYMLEQTI